MSNDKNNKNCIRKTDDKHRKFSVNIVDSIVSSEASNRETKKISESNFLDMNRGINKLSLHGRFTKINYRTNEKTGFEND